MANRTPHGQESPRWDVFISYSHAQDGVVAREVERGLQRFARPLWRARALRVFRDTSAMSAEPDLGSAIQTALGSSAWFILLASPEAAASEWVDAEVDHWFAQDPRGDRFLIVLTAGDLTWDRATGRLAEGSTAAPPAVVTHLRSEPRYVDVRGERERSDLDWSTGEMRAAVIDLAAKIHGRPKDALEGEDLRTHRRAVRLRWSAVAALVGLTVAAVLGFTVATANQQRADREAARAADEADRANTEADRANVEASVARSRALASLALVELSDQQTARAALLSLEALRQAPTVQARESLHEALRRELPAERLALPFDTSSLDVEFIADGTKIVTGGADGWVRVWDIETGAELDSFGPLDGAWSVTHSEPLGMIAAGNSFGGPALVWSADDGRLIAEIPTCGDNVEVSFDPSGRLLATLAGCAASVWELGPEGVVRQLGEYDDVSAVRFDPAVVGKWYVGTVDGGVRVHTAESATAVSSWRADDSAILAVAVSPDATRVATGNASGSVIVWDAGTGRELVRPPAHSAPAIQLAFSPDGVNLASGGSDALIWLSEVETGEVIAGLRGHSDAVTSLAFVDTRVVSGSLDGTVRIWSFRRSGGPDGDEAVFAVVSLASHDLGVLAVDVSPDDQLVAAVGFGADDPRVWQLDLGEESNVVRTNSGRLPTGGDDPPAGAVWIEHAGGRSVTAAVFGPVRIWDDGVERHRVELDSALRAKPELSPDGARLVLVDDTGVAVFAADTGLVLREVPGATASAFSPTGELIVVAGADRFELLDAQSADTVGTSPGASSVSSMTFGEQGRLVGAASPTAVSVWDVETSGEIARFSVEALPGRDVSGELLVRDLVVLERSRAVAAKFNDGALRIWDIDRPGAAPVVIDTDVVTNVATDGSRLVVLSPEGLPMVLDATGNELTRLEANSVDGNISVDAFSPDGGLVYGRFDGRVVVWNAESGAVLATMRARSDAYLGNDLDLSPDGLTLAVLDGNEDIRVFATVAGWVDRACEIAGRNLTMSEWTEYVSTTAEYVRHCPKHPAGPGAPPGARAVSVGEALVASLDATD